MRKPLPSRTFMTALTGIPWVSNHFIEASFQHTTTHVTPENVIVPVTFIYTGNTVLSGTSCGCARITDANTWCSHTSVGDLTLLKRNESECFRIAEDVVQAVVRFCRNITLVSTLTRLSFFFFNSAYSHGCGVRQIVTGVAEKGPESVIRYWVQEPSLKQHAEPRLQAANSQ